MKYNGQNIMWIKREIKHNCVMIKCITFLMYKKEENVVHVYKIFKKLLSISAHVPFSLVLYEYIDIFFQATKLEQKKGHKMMLISVYLRFLANTFT